MTTKKICFAAMGECMLELSPKTAKEFTMSFGGDTYNVSVYLARCSDLTMVEVAYVTALGDDPYSNEMISVWSAQSINVQWVRRFPHKLPGLYFIHTDADGERSFYYYRSQSPAREMLLGEEGDELLHALLNCNYFYFSSIVIAILYPDLRIKLLDFIKAAHKKGIVIVFDTNYRARLWNSQQEARTEIEKFLPYVDIALPSLNDEQILFGDHTSLQCAERLHQYGISEIVVKHGKEGCFLSGPQGQQTIAAPEVKKVVDTTAAGDSFNGAYLAARIKGLDMKTSAHRGMELAATVIGYSGAIIPIAKMPK